MTKRETVSFELERFELLGDERLEVSGRWFGVRGRRFVRPSLTVLADGRKRRSLALLEHKPWSVQDGERWLAAFPWRGDPRQLADAELAVAPGIAVCLPAPIGDHDRRQRRAGGRADSRHEPAKPSRRRAPPPHPSSAELMRARRQRDALNEALAEERQRTHHLRDELERMCADKVEAVDARRAAALSALEGVIAERDAAAQAARAALAERDALVRERDAARAAGETAKGQREAALAERDRLAAERRAAAAQCERLGRERDAERADRERLVRQRDAATAEHQRLARERDNALAERRPLARQNGAGRDEWADALRGGQEGEPSWLARGLAGAALALFAVGFVLILLST
jgi:hypothetical protein